MPILRIVMAPSTRAPILVPNTSSTVKNPTMMIGAMSMWKAPKLRFVFQPRPMSRMKSLRYTPQYFEMTDPAMSISRMRSHPMIHAMISPMVA